MAGTLLIHVGLDLFFEGVSAHGFSALEIISIWAIVVSMTLFGMTAGLAAGMVLAAITFVVDAGPAHLSPIRGHMPATTLRSSKWRSKEAREILNKSDGLRRIVCVQVRNCEGRTISATQFKHFNTNPHATGFARRSSRVTYILRT
jgi:sulfate permease, SulP family